MPCETEMYTRMLLAVIAPELECLYSYSQIEKCNGEENCCPKHKGSIMSTLHGLSIMYSYFHYDVINKVSLVTLRINRE